MNNDVFFRDDADKLMAYLKGYMKGGRYIPILDTIDDKLVNQVAAALIQMEVEEVKPITLFIHTDGGTGKGFMLENVINSLRSPVDGLVFGSACSMGAILPAGNVPNSENDAAGGNILPPSRADLQAQRPDSTRSTCPT